MPRRIIADVMSWIIEAYYVCMYVYKSFPVTSVEMPQATTLIWFAVQALCVPVVEPISVSAKANTWLLAVFFFPTPEAGLAEPHSIAGGGDEPQLLSDVNAAQARCSCGHSPSDSSNQLMAYLTLPSSPHQLTSAGLLKLVMDAGVESTQILRGQWRSEWKRETDCHLSVTVPVKAAVCI